MIIFTDLDGTLLDHATYGFEPARPALDLIKAKGIPLIFATSKTAAEIAPLREATGIVAPAIVENGAGIDWPGEENDAPADEYAAIRAALAAMPEHQMGLFRGFGDMDAGEIADLTGLSPEAAELAKRRRHSEPGIFTGLDGERASFLAALSDEGLAAAQGGRFLTLSRGATKADRLGEIVAWARTAQTGSAKPLSLALGDAQNDIAMIEAADHGVIVANGAHPPLAPLPGEREGRVTRTEAEGPAGWNEAVLAFIQTHDKGQTA